MTLAGRLFHRAGAATKNAHLASSVHILRMIRRGVLEGLRVCDKTWSCSSEFMYGGDDIRRALNVRVATLWLMQCTRGLAASVTTATEAWHWFCCCSASRHGLHILTALQSIEWRRRGAIQQWIAIIKTRRDDAAPDRYGQLCGQHVPYVAQSTRVEQASTQRRAFLQQFCTCV